MANGYSFPVTVEAQVDFLRHLDEAGIAAIAVGEQRQIPTLAGDVSAYADEIGFPVLSTAFDVPVSALSRAVAAANQPEEQVRLMQTMRLHDRFREAVVEGRMGLDLLDLLDDDLHCDLRVLDPVRGTDVLADGDRLPDDMNRGVIGAIAGRSEGLPALTRVPVGGRVVLVVPIHSRRPTGLLQVERRTAEREEERRLGAELLAGLVDGCIDGGVAQHQLTSRGLASGPLVIVAWGNGEGERGPGSTIG